MENNIALYIDGENISHGIIENFFIDQKNKELYNNIVFSYIYFSERQAQFISKKYQKIITKRNIQIIKSKEFKKGKNSADIALAVDIIESIFLCPEINHYIIATNDSDFSSVVLKLQKYNKTVSILSNELDISNSLSKYTDNIINETHKKKNFNTNNIYESLLIIENNIPKSKKNDGFYNIDNIVRVGNDIFSNFSIKKMGFEKLIEFIDHHKNIFHITIKKKKNNTEYWIQLKK